MAQYTKALLTYLDILGFREIVKSIEPAKIVSLLRSFTRLSEPPPGERETWGLSFTNFSDLAVRALPIKGRPDIEGPQGLLFWELLDLAYIQASLILNGVFIRGAMTVGDIYIQDRLIFGPALIRGYELERTVALYPRIVLDSRVFESFNESIELRTSASVDERHDLVGILRRDADNVWFVDYLRAKQKEVKQAAYLTFLIEHKNIISHAASDIRELEGRSTKLGWAINYHNRAVNALSDDVLSSCGQTRDVLILSDE